MENASKALLIAGTILISLLVIGALVFVYRDITSAKRADEETLKTQQLEEFNKQFTSYERNLTGSELLSLVNKMADYNKGQAEKKGYSEMNIIFTVTKDIACKNFLSNGQYDLESKVMKGTCDLTEVSKKINNIVVKYKGDANLQKYASKLNETWDDWSKIRTDGKTGKEKFKEDIKAIGLDDSVAESEAQIKDIQNYADYIEFKRKTFEHKNTDYDKKNGRVIKMTFKEKEE